MPHPPWSTDHRPRGQVLQSARSPALPSPRQLRVSGFTSLTTPPTHAHMHAHTHAITLTPAREGGFEEDVGAQYAPGAVSGAKQPSRWRLPRVLKGQAGGPSSPRLLPSQASCCEGQGPSSLRPEKQRHWRAPAPRDCGHTAPAPGPFTPRKRVADLCPAGLPPLSPEGEASPLGRRPPSRRGGAQLPNGSPGLQAHSHHSPAVAPL